MRRRRDRWHARTPTHTHTRDRRHERKRLDPTQTVAANANSLSMPFLEQPKNLDGSMAGDVGFDPLGLSEIDDLGIDLYWLREAELKHGRVAMLAATGVIWVEGFGPLPGWPEADGRSQMDVFWDAWEEFVRGVLFMSSPRHRRVCSMASARCVPVTRCPLAGPPRHRRDVRSTHWFSHAGTAWKRPRSCPA